MLLTTQWVKVYRQLKLDVYKLFDEHAKRREQAINARLVIDAVWMNVGYENVAKGGRLIPFVWETMLGEIAEYTGLTVNQVRRTIEFLKTIPDPIRQGNNSLMLLEIQTLTENQRTYPTGTTPIRQSKTRRTDRVGIRIKALFLQRFEQGDKTYPTDVNAPNRRVITEISSQKLKKEVPHEKSFSADHVPCTPIVEQFANVLNVKVKNGLVKDDTHERFGNSPEPSSRPDRVMQTPTGKTQRAGVLIENQKRIAKHTDQGKPSLTTSRGGLTFDEAKQQYPELEHGLKYLTYLNNLGVTFYPTHLDKFKTITGKLKPDPMTLRNPIYDKLQEASKHRLEFDTVKAFTDHMKNPVVAAPIEFKMQANELPY